MLAVDLVFGGAGTMLPALGGAFFALRREWQPFDVARVAGTSAGAIAASAVAFGFDEARAKAITHTFLADGARLLDVDPVALVSRFGVARGDRLRDAIRSVLPHRLGDSPIPLHVVTFDVEARAPVVFSSTQHPHLPLADVVAASCSIPFLFAARRIPGARGLHADGGTQVNVAMGLFDDDPRPTLGVRISSTTPTLAPHDDATPRTDVGSPLDYAARIVGAVLDNASRTHVSSKRWPYVVDVVTSGSSLAFSLSRDEIERRWSDGEKAARAFLSA